MNKVLIQVDQDGISNDSVIVYKDGRWVAVNKVSFLNSVSEKLKETEDRITSESDDVNDQLLEIKLEIAQMKDTIRYLLGEEEETNEEE